MESRGATITCLSNAREFSEVRKSPIKWRVQPWLVFQILPLRQDPQVPSSVHKLGFAIRGAYLNAVKRNRLKRVIRALLRDTAKELPYPVWIVVWVSRRVTKDEWLQHENWFKKNRLFVREKLQKMARHGA